jgi:hypothetical protein
VNLDDRAAIPAEVLVRQLGDETVILDLASGTYFGLDETGTRIWQLLQQGATLREVCGAMVKEFEVAPQDIERDVLDLAGELRDRGLIRIA